MGSLLTRQPYAVSSLVTIILLSACGGNNDDGHHAQSAGQMTSGLENKSQYAKKVKVDPSSGRDRNLDNTVLPAPTPLPSSGTTPVATTPTLKKVFGNYMLAFPTYGESVEAYKREIREAQAIGLDGFVLNAAGWSAEPYYKARAANMFAAAKEMGTNFKLFFSFDMCCGLTGADARDMLNSYGQHPNYFLQAGQQVATTFIGQSLGLPFWEDVLKPIAPTFFIPNFSTTNGNYLDIYNADFNAPTYAQINTDYSSWWKSVTSGLAYFSVGAMPQSLVSSGEAYAQVMREQKKTFFAGVSPYFWVGRHGSNLPRRYYEYHGGEGIQLQWESVINVQKPDWVELITWNDYTESYMSPADPAQMPLRQYFFNVGPLLKSHAGYAELQKYYINWFKSGVQPSITKDAVYFFYRTHPKNLTAPDDIHNIVQYGTQDNINVTTHLIAPATLKVTTGGVVKQFSVPAGRAHTRVPFNAGAQTIELIRSDKSVISLVGDPIDSSITKYNFTTTSGYGYSN